jgi:hypothetical protein
MGMLHPNAPGQQAYADAITRELRVALRTSRQATWLIPALATVMPLSASDLGWLAPAFMTMMADQQGTG